MTPARLAAPLALLAGAAQAQLVPDSWAYVCDRGALVLATYVEAGPAGLVVLALEGNQVALPTDGPYTDEGARFAGPADAPGYVWVTAGLAATLYWREAGQETRLLGCTGQF
jgi:membrane-bound inhibitor of C-type lysozyme